MANQPEGNRIPSGYEGSNIPQDFKIPAIGIEDIDRAFFNLFDKDNQIYVKMRDDESAEMYDKKVPVVFGTGERFALRERREPIRDKSGAIMLPIISIRRTGLDQSKVHPTFGSGIGQDTGDFVIKKKLTARDADYQNIINKLGLKNQSNVASDSNFLNELLEEGADPGTMASRRERHENTNNALLEPDLGKNIYEILTIPFPKRIIATYEIVFWTSSHIHMNQMIEKVLSNYDGQGHTYKITTPSGYYFVAYFDDEIISDDNLEEFTDEERIIRYNFTAKVPGFLIANQNGGDMVPVRKYLSAPQISFEIYDGNLTTDPNQGTAPTGNPDDYMLNNLDNLDNRGRPIRPLPNIYDRRMVKDPKTGKIKEVFVKLLYRDGRSGESVYYAKNIDNFEIP